MFSLICNVDTYLIIRNHLDNDEFVRCTQTRKEEHEQRAILWFEEYFATAGDHPPNGRNDEYHLDITTKKDIYASKSYIRHSSSSSKAMC